MITRMIQSNSKDFFHARPAALIASRAKDFESVIMVIVNKETANAKNPIALMRLCHPNGNMVEILADGPDEKAAAKAVAEVIEKIFN